MSHYRTTFAGPPPFPYARAHRNRQQNGSESMPHTPRILFVSADRTVASEVRAFLLKSGFDAVVAYDGAGALRLARAHRFDMLVADVELSPVDGVRIATAFRNINPASHVFLVTTEYEFARQLLIGANLAWDFRILLKPIELAQLIEVLRGAWSDEARVSE